MYSKKPLTPANSERFLFKSVKTIATSDRYNQYGQLVKAFESSEAPPSQSESTPAPRTSPLFSSRPKGRERRRFMDSAVKLATQQNKADRTAAKIERPIKAPRGSVHTGTTSADPSGSSSSWSKPGKTAKPQKPKTQRLVTTPAAAFRQGMTAGSGSADPSPANAGGAMAAGAVQAVAGAVGRKQHVPQAKQAKQGAAPSDKQAGVQGRADAAQAGMNIRLDTKNKHTAASTATKQAHAATEAEKNREHEATEAEKNREHEKDLASHKADLAKEVRQTPTATQIAREAAKKKAGAAAASSGKGKSKTEATFKPGEATPKMNAATDTLKESNEKIEVIKPPKGSSTKDAKAAHQTAVDAHATAVGEHGHDHPTTIKLAKDKKEKFQAYSDAVQSGIKTSKPAVATGKFDPKLHGSSSKVQSATKTLKEASKPKAKPTSTVKPPKGPKSKKRKVSATVKRRKAAVVDAKSELDAATAPYTSHVIAKTHDSVEGVTARVAYETADKKHKGAKNKLRWARNADRQKAKGSKLTVATDTVAQATTAKKKASKKKASKKKSTAKTPEPPEESTATVAQMQNLAKQSKETPKKKTIQNVSETNKTKAQREANAESAVVAANKKVTTKQRIAARNAAFHDHAVASEAHTDDPSPENKAKKEKTLAAVRHHQKIHDEAEPPVYKHTTKSLNRRSSFFKAMSVFRVAC